MYVAVVVAALLSCCAGEALGDSKVSASQKIQAFAGETAILPCETTEMDIHKGVEWCRMEKDCSRVLCCTDMALVYRDGRETHEDKSPVFQNRTSLIMDKLKNGNRNISLRIPNVQLSDAGTYRCRTSRQKVHKDVMVELSVGAVSEPTLSTVKDVGGGVNLQCEAKRWFLKPEITFVDDQENYIDAEEPNVREDSSGHFTVSRRVTLPTHTNRVKCKVHQPQINQTRVAEFYIPDECMNSCTTVIIIAAVVAICLCALTAIICLRCGQFDLVQKLPLCQRNHRNTNATAELLRKIDELNLSPHDKDMKIRQLIEKLSDRGQPATDNSPSRSVSEPSNPPPQQIPLPNSPKPVALTSSGPPTKPGSPPRSKDLKPGAPEQNPAPAAPIQRSSDDHSGPTSPGNAAPPPSPTSAPAAEGSFIGRSQSLSRPRPNINKLPRRNTLSAVPIHLTNSNRFSPLANLPEDNEPLLDPLQQ